MFKNVFVVIRDEIGRIPSRSMMLSVWMVVTIWSAVQNTAREVKIGFGGCFMCV
jgi:hypothetical protein